MEISIDTVISACYSEQSVAGVSLVVSPLIALMKDQLDHLEAKGIPAATLNSTQSTKERSAVLTG